MFLYGSNGTSNGHHNQLTFQAMRRSSQYPYPPAQSQQPGQAADDDEEEYEEEEEEEYDESTSYQQQQAYQRPHGRLAPSGLSLPPALPFAPLAKLNSQQAGGGGRGSGAPYVYSPQTVPVPPPPAQGYMHPQLRAPSQPSPGHPAYQQQQQQQQGQFSVLRTDRRTGNLQVAGMSQATHAGAVHAMRQGPPQGGQQVAGGGQEEPYAPRAPAAQPGSYVCSVPGCGKRYTFASNLRRHVRTAHPEIA